MIPSHFLHQRAVIVDFSARIRKIFKAQHCNRLNGEMIEQLLTLFEEKHYKFVSLDVAQSDAAYQKPDTYISKYGPMWGYRWAKERNVIVNGSLEPDPPKWILEYGK
jgi:hypothetical protein